MREAFLVKDLTYVCVGLGSRRKLYDGAARARLLRQRLRSRRRPRLLRTGHSTRAPLPLADDFSQLGCVVSSLSALAVCAQNGLDVIIKTDAAGGGPGWDQVNSAHFWMHFESF